jgi:hypothetical protein
LPVNPFLPPTPSSTAYRPPLQQPNYHSPIPAASLPSPPVTLDIGMPFLDGDVEGFHDDGMFDDLFQDDPLLQVSKYTSLVSQAYM